MSARIENFKTDFTLFLEDVKTRHLVKVVTDDKIIECSGVILSQHSEKLREMIQEDEEVFLQGYESVEALLTILHGGAVLLTMDSCLEIIKFAWEFGIPNIAKQAICYMESIASEENLVPLTKICLTANNLIKFFDVENDEDAFWPIESVIRNFTIEEIVQFVNNFQPTEVINMFKNKTIVTKILNPLSKRVNEQNVKDIVNILQEINSADLVTSTSNCSKEDATLFFEAIEGCSISKSSMQFLHNLKRLIFNEIGNSSVVSMPSKPDVTSILKFWKTYDTKQMTWICQQKIESFYQMEIILSWVSLFKPSKRIVNRICGFINPSMLCSKYKRHVISIFETLGYEQKFDLNKSSTELKLVQYNPHVSNIVEMRSSLVKNRESNKIIVKGKEIRLTCTGNKASGGKLNMTVILAINNHTNAGSGLYLCKGITDDMPWPEPFPLNNQFKRMDDVVVFAKTADGQHVPFYTDPQLAAEMNYDLNSIEITIPLLNTSDCTFRPKRARKTT